MVDREGYPGQRKMALGMQKTEIVVTYPEKYCHDTQLECQEHLFISVPLRVQIKSYALYE